VNRQIVACLIAISAILVVAMFTGCIEKDGALSTPTPTSTFLHTPSPMSPGNMQLTSPYFENGTLIPKKFTCDGADINPPLVIAGIPAEAQSLALIVDDPDAPGGTWVHWVVYNIPVVYRIDEGSIPGTPGINDFGRKDYGGPCPPYGTHRYFFKIYALDTELALGEGAAKEALEQAMQGHRVDHTELIGLYTKE
jgi:Raf kinase inhibitor-like YbhB/YbcL family protein